jgi:predicted ATP-grasp superfamily ATP-dependent carboligase
MDPDEVLRRFRWADPNRPPVVLLGGLNVVRALGLGGIPVIVAACHDDEPALDSRHCTARWRLPPLSRPDAVVDSLVMLATHLRRRFRTPPPLFFSNDDFLCFVSANRARLERRFRLLLNDEATTAALLDKRRFAEFARQRRLPVPASLTWDGRGRDGLAGRGGPVLVKPANKCGMSDVPALASLFEANKALVRPTGAAVRNDPAIARARAHLVFHEYVPGADRELWCFDAVADESGRVIACHTGRKLRCAPPLTGDSSYIELSHNAQLKAVGREIAATLPLKGIFNMDFKRDPASGRFYLLEINARCNLWLYMGAKNGMNLAKVLYEYLVAGSVSAPAGYRERYRWLDFALDRTAYRVLAAQGHMTRTRWLATLAAPKVYALFAWHDPAPLLRAVGRKVRRRLGFETGWAESGARA